MKRFVFSLFLVALTLGLSLCFVDLSFSIPISQQDCDFDAPVTTSTSFVLVPNSSVTVNNSFFSRNCIISFSAEAINSTEDVGVDVTYEIDGGGCSGGIGPESFHHGTPTPSGGVFLTETHTSIEVRTLGPGMHTIKPCFNLVDAAGDGGFATLANRCLIVGCRTN